MLTLRAVLLPIMALVAFLIPTVVADALGAGHYAPMFGFGAWLVGLCLLVGFEMGRNGEDVS